MESAEVDLEVQELTRDVKFNKEIYDEAVILAAYDMIKNLYDENKISKKELNTIKNKYSINVE